MTSAMSLAALTCFLSSTGTGGTGHLFGPEIVGPGARAGGGEHDPDEVAWNTAVEAAPWLVGEREPKDAVEPEELYERLEPFKRLVAEDIRGDSPDEPAD